jgi:hypothetical protein
MNTHLLHRTVFTALLVGLTATYTPALGQTGVHTALKKLMEDLRKGKAETVNTNDLYQTNNIALVLPALTPYYRDSSYTVRCKAYSLTANVGTKTTNAAVRKQVVQALLQGCGDTESGVSGTCSKALQQFSPVDFDDKAKQQLGALLTPNRAYLNHLAQMAGYIGQPEYEGTLQNLLLQPKLSKKDKWALQLALARMGNPEMLSRVVSRVKSVPVNDDLVYEAAPALVYIRQPQSMDYLFEIMMSDNPSCESAKPDSDEKILCAYRVLEHIAPVVKDFPLKLDESGDLDVKDYQAALQTARSWYSQHKHNYTLIKDTF